MELHIRGTELKVEIIELLTNYTWTAYSGDKKFSISRTLMSNMDWYERIMYEEVRKLVLLTFPYVIPTNDILFKWYTQSKTLHQIADGLGNIPLFTVENMFHGKDANVIEYLLFTLGEI